jgi:hypothetical protein
MIAMIHPRGAVQTTVADRVAVPMIAADRVAVPMIAVVQDVARTALREALGVPRGPGLFCRRPFRIGST